MRSSETTADVNAGVVALNATLTNPTKDRTADIPGKEGRRGYSYTYADLASIVDAVRPRLNAVGLAVVQEAAAAPNGVAVTTRIVHTSGEWLEFEALVIPCAADARAIGSAITYARRYALCAALGIATDDDDDGAGSVPREERAVPTAPRTPSVVVAADAPSGAVVALDGLGNGTGEGPTPTTGTPSPADDTAPASDTTTLAALLEAVDGSEVRAINAVNKARHTSYKKADLEGLQPSDWAAGLGAVMSS